MGKLEIRRRLQKLIDGGWQIECRQEGVDALLAEIKAPIDDEHRKSVYEEVVWLKHRGKAKALFGQNGRPAQGRPSPQTLVWFAPAYAARPASLLPPHQLSRS